MRYDYNYDEQLFGYLYEEELKKLNLVKIPKIEVTFVRHNYLKSTDDENVLATNNYSYAYYVKNDDFVTIGIKQHVNYNSRIYSPEVWNMALASMSSKITVVYNGTDEEE